MELEDDYILLVVGDEDFEQKYGKKQGDIDIIHETENIEEHLKTVDQDCFVEVKSEPEDDQLNDNEESNIEYDSFYRVIHSDYVPMSESVSDKVKRNTKDIKKKIVKKPIKEKAKTKGIKKKVQKKAIKEKTKTKGTKKKLENKKEEQADSGRESPDYHRKWRTWKPVSAIKKLIKENPKLSQEELIERIAGMMREQKPHGVPKLAIYSEKGVYRCRVCEKLIPRGYQAAVIHYRTNHGPRYMKCLCCGLEFRCKVNLTRHEKRCKAEYTNLQLKARAIVLNENKINKGLNFFKFKDTEKYNAMFEENVSSRNDTQQTIYMCDQCPMRFVYAQTLKEHTLRHEGIKPYQCDLCQRTFYSKSRLTVHIKRHYNPVSCVCDQCGKSFKCNSYLRTHALSHLGVKQYPCEECGKRYAVKDALKNHVRREHLKLPPKFPCQFCDKGFPKRYQAREHALKAHGEVILENTSPVFSLGQETSMCEWCGKVFPSASALQEHVHTHDLTDFVCKECGNSYASKNSLKRHIDDKHNHANHACHVCEKIYSCTSLLREHLVSAHSVVDDGNVDAEIEVKSEPVKTPESVGVKFIIKDSKGDEIKIRGKKDGLGLTPNPINVVKTIGYKNKVVLKDSEGKEVKMPKGVLEGILSFARKKQNTKNSRSSALNLDPIEANPIQNPHTSNVTATESDNQVKTLNESPSCSKVTTDNKGNDLDSIEANPIKNPHNSSFTATESDNQVKTLDESPSCFKITTDNKGNDLDSIEANPIRNPHSSNVTATTESDNQVKTLDESPSCLKVTTDNICNDLENISDTESTKHDQCSTDIPDKSEVVLLNLEENQIVEDTSVNKVETIDKSPSCSKVTTDNKYSDLKNISDTKSTNHKKDNSRSPKKSKVKSTNHKNNSRSSKKSNVKVKIHKKGTSRGPKKSKVRVVKVNSEENQIVEGICLKECIVNNIEHFENIHFPNILKRSQRKKKIKVWD